MQPLMKLWNSTKYSVAGLSAAWKRELAFRLEVLVVLCFSPLLLILTELSRGQKVIMLVMLILPLILELVNSSIEALCNLISKETHPEIKFIKDAASGAVFLANILMILTWILCLWPLV
jgi:diacylglycerol kinase (ATP)